MGRMLALLAGTAGIGFGSAAVAQRHRPELLERSAQARVAERIAPPTRPRTAPTTKLRTAQASAPTLQAPAQFPAPATPAATSVVSGGS